TIVALPFSFGGFGTPAHLAGGLFKAQKQQRACGWRSNEWHQSLSVHHTAAYSLIWPPPPNCSRSPRQSRCRRWKRCPSVGEVAFQIYSGVRNIGYVWSCEEGSN